MNVGYNCNLLLLLFFCESTSQLILLQGVMCVLEGYSWTMSIAFTVLNCLFYTIRIPLSLSL